MERSGLIRHYSVLLDHQKSVLYFCYLVSVSQMNQSGRNIALGLAALLGDQVSHLSGDLPIGGTATSSSRILLWMPPSPTSCNQARPLYHSWLRYRADLWIQAALFTGGEYTLTSYDERRGSDRQLTLLRHLPDSIESFHHDAFEASVNLFLAPEET